ncbi:hypothetical protein SUVZ_13G0850 [Saccharomyces uvarum]|uniref:Serine/threonine-protein phosphatase n=1 Tax=Saccharomyces uvarum TaxID=230603 RepID=A0ABN8WJU8_SACUV|nr:hypothetical protein SUVZ_13G0850 [Saccharomyces uvarum]
MSSDAIRNTEQINAAIKIIENKAEHPESSATPVDSKLAAAAVAVAAASSSSSTQPARDLTQYTLDDGRTVATNRRIMSKVPAITSHIPTDEELFQPNGLPRHEFLRDHFKREGKLSQAQAAKIITLATELLSKEPNLISVPAPITVCGDIHGQYFDLLKLFEVGGDPATTSYLFLGDYVDRGSFSFECLIYLYSLKLNFNDHFWLLRGNHECKHLTSYFTFKNEMLHKYDLDIYEKCCESFNNLPLAALMNGQYLCVHGGISPELNSLQDINNLNRFKEIPSHGLMCDLLWADPIEEYDEVTDKDLTEEDIVNSKTMVPHNGKMAPSRDMFVPNSVRGCSYAFTYRAACHFLQETGLLSIIRAHEAQDAGYRMYKNTKTLGFPSLLTLFSAPNYLDTYNNKAAILKYENNVMNIRQFNMTPHPYWLPDFMDVFTWSLPFVGEKVTEMLVAILNICTEDELEVETPVIEELVGTDKKLPQASKPKEAPKVTTSTSRKYTSILDDEHRRKTLRNKILAVAKVSRMYSVLREENSKVQFLKDHNSGVLPRGALSNGIEGLDEALSTFERARKHDLINEKLPPSLDEVKNENKKYYEKVWEKVQEHDANKEGK